MKVAVTGSTGLIGAPLVDALRRDGHEVVRLVRREPRGAEEVRWEPGTPLDPAALAGVEGAVHLAGAGIGDKRWTPEYKRTLVDSRVKGTTTLAEALAKLDPLPRVLVSGSAIGYYGEGGDRPLDESAPPGDDFLARLCVQWEAATAAAEAAGIRVVHARTGLVVSPKGGAWGRMFPIFKLGIGGRLGSGKQYWSPISLRDEVRALVFLLTENVSGAANLTGPHPVTNSAATSAMGLALHRPTVLPVPAFALRIVLGEFASEPLRSQRVLPKALLDAGFTFDHPTIADAIRAAL